MIGTLGLILGLGACSRIEKTVSEKTDVHTTRTTKDSEETAILVKDIPITFEANTTKAHEFSEEDNEVYKMIMSRLNESDGTQSDQEIVHEVAKEVGEDPEAYYNNWRELVETDFYGGTNDIIVTPDQQAAMFHDIILKIINGQVVNINQMDLDNNEDYSILEGIVYLTVDDIKYELEMILEHDENYSEIELIELYLDDEEIKLD